MTTASATERQKSGLTPNPAGSQGFRINGSKDLQARQSFTFKIFLCILKQNSCFHTADEPKLPIPTQLWEGVTTARETHAGSNIQAQKHEGIVNS